jgi:hypothetical protein
MILWRICSCTYDHTRKNTAWKRITMRNQSAGADPQYLCKRRNQEKCFLNDQGELAQYGQACRGK